MSSINENNFNNYDIRLSNSAYWDLMLSSDQGDFDTSLINPTTIYTGTSFAADFTFAGASAYTSTTTYISATTTALSAETLCDFVFTGVDNRRVSPDVLTGLTYTGCCTGGTTNGALTLYSGNTALELYAVTGDNYTYNMEASGSTTSFRGGWYQGIFKIDGSRYEVLPYRYPAGWTTEFWLANHMTSGVAGNMNLTKTNNAGIFFYLGQRAENKYWKKFAGDSGYTTCTGVHLYPTTVTDSSCGGVSPFVSYSASTATTATITSTPSTGVTTFNWSGDVVDNCFALRMKNDGSIGYRKIKMTGECINNVWYSGYTIEEKYSATGLITQGQMCHVAVKWKPNNHIVFSSTIETDFSLENVSRTGTLYFYINGEQKFKVDDVDELSFRRIGDHSSKQIGVPYNISVGGGTQGLAEQITFGGPDANDQNLLLEQNFGGHLEGRIAKFRFHLEPLDITQIKRNYLVEKSTYL